MYIKFNNLSEEKRETIIKSAIEEFSQNGFYKASTDKIAYSANIAKGSLFHYFKNKKNLYLYIVKYCMDFIGDKVKKEANNIKVNDFYERMKLIAIFKQNIFVTYEFHTKIILDSFSNRDEEIKEDMQILTNEYYADGIQFMEDYILKYMDAEYLRDGITTQNALFMTTTMFEALGNKYMNIYKSALSQNDKAIKEVFDEFDRYIDIMKYGLYKNNLN